MLDALFTRRFSAFREVWEALDARRNPVAVSGLSDVHKAHLVANLYANASRPLLLMAADEQELARLNADVTALTGHAPAVLPVREPSYHNVEAASHEWEQARLKTLYRIATGNAPVVLTTADALLLHTLPKQRLEAAALTLEVGATLAQSALIAALDGGGYRRCEQVEGVGQYAVRGGLVDFFSPTGERPVRVEFFGNEIDTLGAIDPDSQRRVENLPRVVLLPVRELLPDGALLDNLQALCDKQKKPTVKETITRDLERLRETGQLAALDRYLPLLYPTATPFDYLPPETLVVICEKSRCRERREATWWRHGQDVETLLENGLLDSSQTTQYLDETGWTSKLKQFDVLYLDTLPSGGFELPPRALVSVQAKQLPSYGGSLETAVGDIAHYRDTGVGTLVLCGARMRCHQLEQLLRDKGIAAQVEEKLSSLPMAGQVLLTVGGLSAGFEYHEGKLAVITEGQLLASPGKKRRAGQKDARQRVASYTDLTPGDLVVHEHHGIGRFTGIKAIEVDGASRDFIQISYAGTDSLYVPVTQLNLVSKYIGAGEEVAVKLNKLGGADWSRAKSRAKAGAKELAAGLIALYAERLRKQGFAFPADSDWQREFEEAFPYDETDDQLTAIADAKRDMESTLPMDRLLCGDVGFGKTEVALRMVMKCVLGGKQAALLVPTTVLAQQHYNTALQRFGRFPLRVDMVSRFRSAAQNKQALTKLHRGEIDLLIGTHRLLSKDVKFKDLGLLVVDEEQRFGVSHKEKLKALAKQVDVLTLTATPIPRTLNMALSGIRDMSTLEQPPRDRYPVQTFVLEHDDMIIDDAIRREIGRGGQVFYLHNRVESIDLLAMRLRRRHPDVPIAVAHGQMDEKQLADMMRQMAEGQIGVLVCTTIIETGLDIANANTLIIEDADKMGLAQLHQIRGRVGRSNRHASAYLTYRRGKILSEVATKRLSAVREFAEFGSGFKIAMRDLEIRGAGNILGPEQHGHMLSVGYDMYLKLLEEAVLEEKGETARPSADALVDLPLSAGIPEKYVAASGVRMDLYRRIALLRDGEQAADLLDELIDRFGEPPKSTQNLIDIALLRNAAAESGFSEVAYRDKRVTLALRVPDLARVSRVCSLKEYRGRLLFSPGDKSYLTLRPIDKTPLLAQVRTLVGQYAES